ncbi:50S ribosomal protein L33 [Parcubacteria bacterium DG_74_2]|nr:MAG: 50S ribosomal protein L33 [Parcubacteria bacterium DG_74_2]
MPKKKAQLVRLQCTKCKEINYRVKKSKKITTGGKKLELKKYCKHCKKHTLHKEIK